MRADTPRKLEPLVGTHALPGRSKCPAQAAGDFPSGRLMRPDLRSGRPFVALVNGLRAALVVVIPQQDRYRSSHSFDIPIEGPPEPLGIRRAFGRRKRVDQNDAPNTA